MIEGVPNFAFVFGYTNASWTLKGDLACQYVTRLLNGMRSMRVRQCVPVNSIDSIEALPFLDLTSGYIRRAVERLPKRGSRFPWQVHQNYLRDYQVLKLRGIRDKAMVFSNPVAAGRHPPTAPGEVAPTGPLVSAHGRAQ
jgi:hypothetical protein